MGREIRRVPTNWEHPVEDGEFKPLCDDYVNSLNYFKDSVDQFIKHMTEVIKKGKTVIYDTEFTNPTDLYKYFVEDEEVIPPNINEYMPEGDWYQLYENVTEGTPLSPPFKTKAELVDWLSSNKDYWDHQWTREQAEAMVKKKYAPSMVIINNKFYSAEESLLIKNS